MGGVTVKDRWTPSSIYTFRCGWGVRLVASDSEKLERLWGAEG